MSTLLDAGINPDQLPPIPLCVRSFDGQMINTSSDVWRLRASSDGGKIISINWKLLEQSGRGLFSERGRYLEKLYIADRILRKKASTVDNDFDCFTRFELWLSQGAGSALLGGRTTFDWSDLNETIARAFLDHGVTHTGDAGNDYSRLRTFYTWGVARQYPDFSHGLLVVLKSIVAPGNSKGHHVRFRDPLKGPISEVEAFLVRKAIESGAGTRRDRAVVMIHLQRGSNPNGVSRLRNGDLKRYDVGGSTLFQLDMPRVKKRVARRQVKRGPISSSLGRLLEELQCGKSEDRLLYWLSESQPEESIRKAMQRFVVSAGIISPRTGSPLHLTPRRFRSGLLTHMAEEGASVFHMAEIADHSDLRYRRAETAGCSQRSPYCYADPGPRTPNRP